ncbi:MAG: hypothetical protein AAGE59_11990 [Cyanobacteria bacterium P01_F01_bin.86]
MVANNRLIENCLQDYPLPGLLIDIQGNATVAQPGSQLLERIITLHNTGDQIAEVELWLDPSDLRSEPIKKWADLKHREPEVILQPHTRLDITLLITLPPDAEAGFYSYDVCAHSPQYGHREIRKFQQLQVLSGDLSNTSRQEPIFTLAPATHSESPHVLRVGKPFILTATIENKSRRTDRYFLSLLDVPPEWFSVEYPENGANLPGLVTRTDGLQLNPGDIGKVTLSIHPPSTTPAGQYFPTVQLSGSNRDEISLLEVVYFSIPIDDRLQVILTPDSQSMPPQRSTFEVTLNNIGNIHRRLSVGVQEEFLGAFAFTVIPDEIELAPNQTASVIVETKPKQWLSRICHRRAQNVPFEILIDNVVTSESDLGHETQPTTVSLPGIPQTLPIGTLNWQPYRRWLYWLVLTLSIVSAISLVGWLAWYFLIWRTNLRPQVILFEPTSNRFQEGGDKPVTLNWDISNPTHLGSIALRWDDTAAPVIYSFTGDDRSEEQSLPNELSNYCTFTETLAPKTHALIAPLLRFHRRRVTGSENLQVLQCRSVPLTGFQQLEGEYDLTLTTYAHDNARGMRGMEKIDALAVAPAPPPEIVSLTPAATAYRKDADSGQLQPLLEAGEPLADASPIQSVPISWQVIRASRIKELHLGSFSLDGNQNLEEQIFDFSSGVPPELDSYCQVNDDLLACTHLPTQAQAIESYNFYLQVIPSGNQASTANNNPIISQAQSVTISPALPAIISFTHNGEQAITVPKRIVKLQKNQQPIDVTLSWEVSNTTMVELLPAPGPVEVNSIAYPVSPTPGTEIIILRAINEIGDAVSQSIVIETMVIEREDSIPPHSPLSPPPKNPETDTPSLLKYSSVQVDQAP